MTFKPWPIAALLLLTSCSVASPPGGAEDDLKAVRAGVAALGAGHPASGPFSPVGESSWATASWAPGAAFVAGEGSNLQISVYSAHATRLLLEVYPAATGSDALYDYWLQKGADGYWRGQLAQVPGKTLYAFRAWGPNWPYSAAWTRGNSSAGYLTDVDAAGNRFDPNKLLFDPYARELSHDKQSPALLAAGESADLYGTGGADLGPGNTYTGPITGKLPIDRRAVDSGRWAPKALALADATSTGARPHLPQKDAIIYEAHVRGLTRHPSAAKLKTLLGGLPGFEQVASIPDALRGTYAGAGMMAPYLKALGYTTIELLPVFETDNDLTPSNGPGGNYWGYQTDGFFAPDRRYSSDPSPGGPTREFKQMVAAFHAAGLEVYLDVVYNHSGEGGTWKGGTHVAQVTSFRGLDNQAYYALVANDHSSYWEVTGCGNDLDSSQPVVRRLVLDSLGYWIAQMGIDGFRFDLAPVLGRVAPDYHYDPNAGLLNDIAALATANDVEMIAEPWDLGTYQIGGFPAGWGEWNGRYRDTVRRYLKGDPSGSGGSTWSDAFYGDWAGFHGAGGPHKSVNLIDAHDGFTLADLVSYDAKTNAARAWPFGPSDGGSDSNDSWSWNGDPALRRQAVRNFLVFQALSRGVPMHVQGDELGRTQNGNNNPYAVDSVATWNNYEMIATDAPQRVATGDASGGREAYHDNLGLDGNRNGWNDLFLFVRAVLQLRGQHPALRQADYSMPIAFSKQDGSAGFDGHSDLMGRVLISGSAVGDADFLLLTNMWSAAGSFTVPAAPAGKSWVRLIDTAGWAEPAGNSWPQASAAAISGTYSVAARSMVLLVAASDAPPPPVSPPVTIYFKSTAAAPRLWVWEGTGLGGPGNRPISQLAGATWPGAAAAAVADSPGWWSWTIPASFNPLAGLNLYFDGDNTRLVRRDPAATGWYADGAWTDTKPVAPPAGAGLHVHAKGFKNVYYWSVLPAGAAPAVAWPGVAMTADTGGWRHYDLPGVSSASLIFNTPDGTVAGLPAQTADLSRAAGDWWYSAGNWTTTNPDPAPNPDPPPPGPAPGADLRSDTIYFVITSRFNDGDPGNNTWCWDDAQAGNVAAGDPCWRGDFAGLIDKLDYIKALGFSAVWITPVVKNASGYDYHGYHALNFKQVDPRLTSAGVGYQQLIDAVHARGMKLIQDVVFNHTGNFGEENLYPLFKKDPSKPDTVANLVQVAPAGLLPANYASLTPDAQFQARLTAMKEDTTDTGHVYHHEKSLSWEGYTVETGQIAGDAVDLDTENPVVTKYLREAYFQYIDMGVDAFRVDTVKHISRLTFNNELVPQLKARGGARFSMFGEVCSRYRQVWNTSIPAISAPFYTWKESRSYPWGDRLTNEASTFANWQDYSSLAGAGEFDSDNAWLRGNDYHAPDPSRMSGLNVIDFPMHWNLANAQDAFSLAVSTDNVYSDATWNVTYVDSHDYAPDGAPENQRFALGQDVWAEDLDLLFTFRGVPALFYGSEVEFQKGKVIDPGPTDKLANTGRAYFGDLIRGAVTTTGFGKYTGATGALAAALAYPLAQHLRQLNLIRRAVPALQKGQYSTAGVSGAMAFKRRYTDAATDSFALVTISGDATFSDIPNGTWVDAVTGDQRSVTGGSLTTSGAGGRGNLRVFVLSTARTPAPGKVVDAAGLAYLR